MKIKTLDEAIEALMAIETLLDEHPNAVPDGNDEINISSDLRTAKIQTQTTRGTLRKIEKVVS